MTKRLVLTLAVALTACDVSPTSTGSTDVFGCATGPCPTGGGGGGTYLGPYEHYRGRVLVNGSPPANAWVELLRGASAGGPCTPPPSFSALPDTLCGFHGDHTEPDGTYDLALDTVAAEIYADWISQGITSVGAALYRDSSGVYSPLGVWEVRPLTTRADSILVIDWDLPSPN